MRRAFATRSIIVFCLAIAGCGSDPQLPRPIPASDFSDPAAGIAFRAPAGAVISKGRDTQVVVLRRGESTLAVSRFPRPGERLPQSARQLEQAVKVLPGEYVRRLSASNASAGITEIPIAAKRATVSGRHAVVVTIGASGATHGRSEHIHFYEFGAEIVVDAVAPEKDFTRANAVLFDPVLSSLKITRPRG